jgi:hypothetical protein
LLRLVRETFAETRGGTFRIENGTFEPFERGPRAS